IQITAAREGDVAAIRVADRGIGIPPELIDTVFDLFAQVERTMDRSEGGRGIGLSLVRNLGQMHGGRVGAASAGRGRGSEFSVLLPCLGNEAHTRADPDLDSASERPMTGLRVLVVDDNRDAADS